MDGWMGRYSLYCTEYCGRWDCKGSFCNTLPGRFTSVVWLVNNTTFESVLLLYAAKSSQLAVYLTVLYFCKLLS
jgi:hypothetical protein